MISLHRDDGNNMFPRLEEDATILMSLHHEDDSVEIQVVIILIRLSKRRFQISPRLEPGQDAIPTSRRHGKLLLLLSRASRRRWTEKSLVSRAPRIYETSLIG